MYKASKIVISAFLCCSLLVQSFGAIPLPDGLIRMVTASAARSVTVKQAKDDAPGASDASRIAGIVWNDANKNGTMDNDEKVVPGVKLTLFIRASDLEEEGEIQESPTPEESPAPTTEPTPQATEEPTHTQEATYTPTHVPTHTPTHAPEPTIAQAKKDAESQTDSHDTIEIIDGVPPLSDGYVALAGTSSGQNGWFVFQGLQPGKYALWADLASNQRLTVMKSGQSVFDPDSFRTSPFMLEGEASQLDNKNLGVLDEAQEAAAADGQALSDGDTDADAEETDRSGADVDADADADENQDDGLLEEEGMGAMMMGTLGAPLIQMIEGSFLTLEEYLTLQSNEQQTFEYLRSVFGAQADLSQVTLEQAQSVTAFNPAEAGVTDMRSTGYLARMGGLTSINLSGQPIGGFAVDAGSFQNLTSLNVSRCGISLSIPAGGLPNLSALNVDGASSVTFQAGAQLGGIAALTLGGVGSLHVGEGALQNLTALMLKGSMGTVSFASGALPAMTLLDMAGANIATLRMEDGSSESHSVGNALPNANSMKLGGIGSWYVGAYALPNVTALNLSGLAATSIEFGNNALSSCATLTLSNAALTTLRFGSNACNAVTKLVLNTTTSSSLQSLSIGSGSLQGITNNNDNTNGLNLSNNTNLTQLSLGSGALSNLTKLTINNTGLNGFDFLDAGALPSCLTLNAQKLSATSITIPGGRLEALKTLDLGNAPKLETLTFASDSVPVMTMLYLTGITTLTKMVVGDRAMKEYTSFNLSVLPSKVHTVLVGDESLNMATTFNVGAYVETLAIGRNSLGTCNAISGINSAGHPLRSLAVGSGSFSAATHTTLNLSRCAELTGDHLSIGTGAFPNVKTLTLDSSGITDLSFLTSGALAGVATLNWKNMTSSELNIPAGVLPNVVSMFLMGSKDVAKINCGKDAMGLLTTLSVQGLTGDSLTISGEGFANVTKLDVTNGTGLTTITIENGGLPQLNTFISTNATGITTLVLGNDALNTSTTLSLSGLPALADLQIGSGALAALTSLTLTNSGLTALTLEEDALPELTKLILGSGAAGSSKLKSLTIGDNSLNKLTTLTFSNAVGAPLETLIVGKNALSGLTTLTLTNNALSVFKADAGSLSALTTLTITGTKMMDMNFLATGGMQQLQKLYMRSLPATELTVPSNTLQNCIALDMAKNLELRSLTFEDNTCPLLPGGGFDLWDCDALATLIVGDNCLNSYNCWHPAEGWLPVKTMIVGNNSLNSAARFGFSDVMETVKIGDNSFGKISSLIFQPGISNGIKVIPPLRSLVVGENSFGGTASTINLTDYKQLQELSVGNGSFAKAVTLTLTGSGLEELTLEKDMLPALKTLTLGSTAPGSSRLEKLIIGAEALPNLTALAFCTSSPVGGPLKSLTVGDGALKSLGTLSLPNNKSIETLQFGMDALGNVTVMDISGAAAGLISFGQGSAPKLTNLKASNAHIGKLAFGKDSCAAYTGATGALLAGAASLREFEAEDGALKSLTALATLPGNQLTRFFTKGSALAKVPVLNLGVQPSLTQWEADLVGMAGLKELYLDGTALTDVDIADGSLQNTLKLALPTATLMTLRFGAGSLPLYAGNGGESGKALLLDNMPELESLVFGAGSLPLPTALSVCFGPKLKLFQVDSGALGGLASLQLTDNPQMEDINVASGALANLGSLDISHSGVRALELGDGRYGKLTQLRAENMDAFCVESGVFTIQNGELPKLQSLWIKGQKAMTTLDIKAGTAASPTLPELTELSVAPLSSAYMAGYEGTSLSDIKFHAYTMPKIQGIELHNTSIHKIVLEANAMPGLKMFYPEAGTVFTEIQTGEGAAPDLYRFQKDNGQLVSLSIGDGSSLNLGNPVPAALSAAAGGDYDPLGGLDQATFQSLRLGAGLRSGPYLTQIDLTDFTVFTTLDLAAGCQLPDLEKLIITGAQLGSFPSLDSVSLPKLQWLHLFQNPLTGAFAQKNLPASLQELRLNQTDISVLDLSGSAMPNLEALVADHCPNLLSVTINTPAPGSFGRKKMDVFRFSNSPALTSMKLDAATISNLMDGMQGDGRSIIELYNTRLGYADLLPLVHPQNAGSNVTIRLPDDFLEALQNGQVPDNTTQDAQVAMLYSQATYNSGSGDAPLAASALADNLYPVYRVQPEIFFPGMVNGQQGPNNSMAGTFQADQTAGGLDEYLASLPESQAQGLRALLAGGFPGSTLGLSANDAACATAEAIAAFLNENLDPALRVASNYNYDKPGENRVSGLSYAQEPDPLTNPEGYKLYAAVMQLLEQARFAAAMPVDSSPASLTGEVSQALTPDPDDAKVATIIVQVNQHNINGRYVITDYSSNITAFQKQTAAGWDAIATPLSYQGDINDVLRLTIDNTDKTAPITLGLKAVNTLGQGDYYDVTGVDNGDYQNDQYKSDYIALRGVTTTDYETPMVLRAAEAVVTVSYKWLGQEGPIRDSDIVRFAGMKPGDKVYTNGSGASSVSAPAISGFVSPTPNCGESLTITGDGDEIIFYYRKPITITAASDAMVYNGQTQTLTGILTNLEGDTLTGLTASGSGKNVGQYDVTVSGTPGLESGKNFAELYQSTITKGTLTITPAPLSLEAASGRFEYDGTEHSVEGYQVIGNGLLGNDKLSVTLAGNRRADAGDSETSIQSVAITGDDGDASGNYAVTSTAKGMLSVVPRALSVVPQTLSFPYNGMQQSVSYTQSGLLPGHTLRVTLSGESRTVAGSNNVSVTAVQVVGAQDVTANYAIATGAGEITIDPAAITVKAGNESYLFSGEPRTVTSFEVLGDLASTDMVDSVQLLNNSRVEEGEQTVDVGTVSITNGSDDVSDCYTITPVPGKITVAVYDTQVLITAKDVTLRYDGQSHQGTEYMVTGLQNGDRLQSVEIRGEGTDVGSYDLIPSGAVIVDAQNREVKAYTKITYVKGSLTITQRPATIAVNSLSVPYDGQEHTADVKISGLLDTDRANVTLLGATRKEQGKNDVTFDASKPPIIMAGGKNVTKNYSLTLTPGTITVTAKGGILRITARNVNATYDGLKHSADGFDVTGLLEGDRVDSVTISGESVNAGTYDLIPSGAKIVDGSGKEVTAGYQRIDYGNGKLIIAKRSLSVSAEFKSFPFDNQPHKVGYTVAGELLKGDTVVQVILTGNARTQLGSNDVLVGKVSVDRNGTDVSGNYEVSKKNGSIQITPRNDLSYRVEYYYAGVLDNAATVNRTSQTLGATVSGYTDKPKAGYGFSRVQYGTDYSASSLIIGLNEANNVIRVYYEQSSGVAYTVEHHYQNAKADGYELGNVDTVGGMKAGDVVSDVSQRIQSATLPGFVLGSREGLPLTLTADSAQNVIRVYYKRVQNVEYRVEYYYNAQLDQAATQRYTGRLYGEVIRKYDDKVKPGYRLHGVETLPFTLTMQKDLNVIRVYYDLIGGGELGDTIVDTSIPLSAGTGSLNTGDAIE